MFLVELKSQSGRVFLRTSHPDRFVEKTVREWIAKGLWVQQPLPGAGQVYRAFKDGSEFMTMTVKEIKDERQ